MAQKTATPVLRDGRPRMKGEPEGDAICPPRPWRGCAWSRSGGGGERGDGDETAPGPGSPGR